MVRLGCESCAATSVRDSNKTSNKFLVICIYTVLGYYVFAGRLLRPNFVEMLVLKKYHIDADGIVYLWKKPGKDQMTVFVRKNIKNKKTGLIKSILTCRRCEEKLGKITDKNIDHQGEYHSCPI